MKLFIQFLSAVLVLATPSCAAPHQQATANQADDQALKKFNDLAGPVNDSLLLKAVQCFAPHDICNLLTLDREGVAVKSTRTPYTRGDELSAKLSADQVAEIRRMLAQLRLETTAPPTRFTEGETYTAFVHFDGEKYARFDYAGAPPEGVQRVVYILIAEINRQYEHEAGQRGRRE